MYKLLANTNGHWTVINTFGSKKEFIDFLAMDMRCSYSHFVRKYKSKYFDDYNVTGKDMRHIISYEIDRNEDGSVKIHMGMPVYSKKESWVPYKFRAVDGNGVFVDIRTWKDEVLTLAMSNEPIRSGKASRRQNRYYHKAYHGVRKLKVKDYIEDDGDFDITSHQMQRLHVRSSLISDGNNYGGPFFTVNSSGWKSHKRTKQWDKQEHAYTYKYSKKNVAFSMMECDELEEEFA